MRLSLVPLKSHRIEGLMPVKSVETESSPVGAVWKFGEGIASTQESSSSSSQVSMVKITGSAASCLHIAL
ncbi:hypothetical protein TNCV_1478311 [Trichonephila clavipes]|nr:hypothetical protein TNCV_1478311 [Trichonephila clavipes]